VLEAVSDHRPREIHIEIQNPAYYLGILKFSNSVMWLTFKKEGGDDIFGVRQHNEKRVENAPKVAILMKHLTAKLESIGEGNCFVGKYFPEEKIWEDLSKFSDTQKTKIQEVWENYFRIICQKLK
jgi:hypothetical protein